MIKNNSGRRFFFIIIFILSIIGVGLVIVLGATHKGINDIIEIGKGRIPFNSLQGTIQTFTLMFCIMMACIDCYIGTWSGFLIVSLMLSTTIISMIRTHALGPLPGALNGVLTLVVILLIGYLLRKARKKSITDYATGMLNSVGLIETLNNRLKEKKNGSLIYYQINNFRSINDDYGHDIGNCVLRITAERIQEVVKDCGIIGRIGGSEFAIIINDKTEPVSLVKEMFGVLDQKMIIENDDSHFDVYIESSAGIAKFNKDGNDSNSLFRCADVALMHALSEGGDGISVFDEEMLTKMNREKEVEQLIKIAYNEKYFHLEYQPQFAVNNKDLRGFESLIRMTLPNGKRISPGDFIPVAEKSNLIFYIDEFVLDYVTKEFADTVKENTDIIISVNISANGISRPEFVSIVEDILVKNNFPAYNLEIEITEYSFDDSQDMTIKNIKKLKEKGIKVALDDFGTGYASLSRLMNLSVDLLKVDKSLVDNIEKDELNRDFINSIGSMGHLLKCKVILEGVESNDQLEYIKKLDCDFVQGYVWGRPMDFENAKILIDQKKRSIL